MKSNLEWILFDCFNTLVDDFDDTGDESGMGLVMDVPVRAGFYGGAEEFVADYERWRDGCVGYGEVLLGDRFGEVLMKRDPNRKDVADVVAKMVRAFEAGYGETLRLTPGVREMLEAWQGVARLGVVSNFFLPDWPARVLGDFGLGDCFEFVVNSAEVGVKKPGEDIYRVALEQAGLPDVGRVLFVGDNLMNDVLAPCELGMQVVHFDRSGDRPMQKQKLPDGIHVIHDWAKFRPV